MAARFGREELLELVRIAGKKVSGARCQCPLEGCKDEAEGGRLNATTFKGREAWVLSCHRCHTTVDYVALYQQVKGVDFLTAIGQLATGAPLETKKPPLRLVRAPVLSADATKLTPDQVRKAWEACTRADELGEVYLEGRRLHEAVDAGLVRFATEASALSELKHKARNNYRIGLLLTDVAGQPRGVQFRTVEAQVDGDKMRSLARGHSKGAYFGNPGGVLGSRVVVVAEGLADTLTALLWTQDAVGTAVVGVPGTGQVASFSDALEDAGVDVSGMLFVLLAQRDKGKRGNQSLTAFMTLKAKLQQRGADVVLESEPPAEQKDWAAAWQEQKLDEWPPTQVRRYLAGDETAGEARMETSTGAAVWQPQSPVEPDYLGKDLTSLTWLLSADVTRVPICGKGEWGLNEMTGAVEYGNRPVRRADLTRIRFNLESYRGSLDNKRLRFSAQDVEEVAEVLAHRRRYHPVREYLEPLKWDGTSRWEQLLAALGPEPQGNGLEEEYLRRWFIAGAARVLKPGVKMDTMLVLYGGQGGRKSTFFEVIGGDWHRATSVELGSKDSIELLRGGWIVELDELDSIFRAKEAGSVKAFLSRRFDDFVPKWVRGSERYARASVFGGSVNEPQFLSDVTGNRRFWVVEPKRRIDIAWVAANRDQLWAEGVHLFRAGEKWWLEDEHEALREAANIKYELAHPWQALIENWLRVHRTKDALRTEELLIEALKVPEHQQTSAQARIVGGVLRRLGWAPAIVGPERARVRIWKRVSP